MNCFTCPSSEGYDALAAMLIPISNLANDDDTLELMNVLSDNKDEKMIKTLGITVLKLYPYLGRHKEDVFQLISSFFVRPLEQTYEKSIIELKDELVEVFTHPMVRELFTSAQTKTLDGMFGSAPENTEEAQQEDSSST